MFTTQIPVQLTLTQRHSSKITMYLVTSCSLVTANKQLHIQVHTLKWR